MIGQFISSLYSPQFVVGFWFIWSLYPIWLPIILAFVFWQTWLHYVRNAYFLKTKYALLEIRIPRDIFKSPRAMESVINTLFNPGGETTFIDRYWNGQTRPSFSLEMVSDGGQIRFLLWTRDNLKNFIESQIYAQFPEVEIHEVPDYVQQFSFRPGENNMWGICYELADKAPLPIMTYVDYGLDENPDEEEKIDPLSQTLEYLSTAKPGEHIWFQIVIRAHKTEKRQGVLSQKTDWRQDIAAMRKKIFENIKKEERGGRPSAGETEILEALARNFQKHPFDCGMRAVYWVEKPELYNRGTVGGLRSFMRPYSHSASAFRGSFDRFPFGGFNGFKGVASTDFDYPWQDFNDFRLNLRKHKILDAYKRRAFFYSYHGLFYAKEIYHTFVLTAEGIATLFHFPGATAAAPGLNRIPSKRAQPPGNLPM